MKSELKALFYEMVSSIQQEKQKELLILLTEEFKYPTAGLNKVLNLFLNQEEQKAVYAFLVQLLVGGAPTVRVVFTAVKYQDGIRPSIIPLIKFIRSWSPNGDLDLRTVKAMTDGLQAGAQISFAVSNRVAGSYAEALETAKKELADLRGIEYHLI